MWTARFGSASSWVFPRVCRGVDMGAGAASGCTRVSMGGSCSFVSSFSTQTVSMLITDLVGSTAMAERLGPAAAEQLRSEHFELLREALERTGGREVKNLGDGLMAAFGSASQSLDCAVDMQQAIEVRNRRAEEQLGVRIGVSLGDATAEGGDYFGWAVCRGGEAVRSRPRVGRSSSTSSFGRSRERVRGIAFVLSAVSI